MGRGVVSSRVTLLLRSAEIKPYWSLRSPSPLWCLASGYFIYLFLSLPPTSAGLGERDCRSFRSTVPRGGCDVLEFRWADAGRDGCDESTNKLHPVGHAGQRISKKEIKISFRARRISIFSIRLLCLNVLHPVVEEL